MRLVVVGIPGSRRSKFLRDAAARWLELNVVEVPWIDLINGRTDLRSIICSNDVVRIDSPGKDYATELALLQSSPQPISLSDAMPAQVALEELRFERGRILWPAAWYAGFCSTLRKVEAQLLGSKPHRLTGEVEQISIAFDKTQTQTRLAARGIRVPELIGRVGNFDELVDRVRSKGWSQCFAKLAHGSSASGAVALRFGRGRMEAFTTTEVVSEGNVVKLFNTRAVRRLESVPQIRTLVDQLSPHALHVERWLPKAGFERKRFDLRVLTVDGKPKQIVARLSESPMTNLHLLNTRGDVDRLRIHCGDASWTSMLKSVEAAAEAFAGCHCLGIDVMFEANLCRHAVLEVNAFGDLLPGALFENRDTYMTQLESLFGPPDEAASEKEAA